MVSVAHCCSHTRNGLLTGPLLPDFEARLDRLLAQLAGDTALKDGLREDESGVASIPHPVASNGERAVLAEAPDEIKDLDTESESESDVSADARDIGALKDDSQLMGVHGVSLSVPLPPGVAQLAARALRPDPEVKAELVTKLITWEADTLEVRMRSDSARLTRTAFNAFFDSLEVVLRSVEELADL